MNVPTPPKTSDSSVKGLFTWANAKNAAIFGAFCCLFVGLSKMNRTTYREFHLRPLRYMADSTGTIGIMESIPVFGMLFDKTKGLLPGTSDGGGGGGDDLSDY